MKKSVLTGIDQMELIEVPKPIITEPNQVLIKMAVVGVCGSDIHYYRTGRIGVQVVKYPFTVGHEGAGIIEAVGENVTNVKPGDRVAVEPAISCGKCDQCLAGRPHTCRNNLFLGCPGQIEGNLAEYMVFPASQCEKLEDYQAIEDGANSEPLAIGLYAVKMAQMPKEAKIGIIGFGPIGMSVMQMAQARGYEVFYVSEKIEAREKMARELGAKTYNPLHEDVAEKLTNNEPELLDCVFECCGQQDAMDTAIDILKPGGKLLIVGIPEFDRWSFKADLARRKEIAFQHIRRQNNCAHDTLKMLASGKVDGKKMITHQFKFEDVAKAFDIVSNYKDGVMKAMVYFD